jgi:hypothetical protein
MTPAAADARSEAASRVPMTHMRHVRVDLIGLGAVLIAGLGLIATIVLMRTAVPGSSTPSVSATLAPAPPARDQWYADLNVATAAPVSSQARDRWYLDGNTASNIAKDRWYADSRRPTP